MHGTGLKEKYKIITFNVKNGMKRLGPWGHVLKGCYLVGAKELEEGFTRLQGTGKTTSLGGR